MAILEKMKAIIRGTIDIDRLRKDGLNAGKNFHVQEGVIIDPGHCWLIEIGDNVTLAPRVHILAHDASTKNGLGYTRINTVKIGNNVFIGAGTIVMPGSVIPDNTVIGAGSLVNQKLNEGGVYVGSPVHMISSYEEYINKQKEFLTTKPLFGKEYIIGTITDSMKQKMKDEITQNDGGFVV